MKYKCSYEVYWLLVTLGMAQFKVSTSVLKYGIYLYYYHFNLLSLALAGNKVFQKGSVLCSLLSKNIKT